MKNLFLSILFIFSFIQLHAQTKNKLSAADSLHFCGYYKEEIVLRKAAPQNILENRILLDNAQVNLYLQSQEIEKAKTLFDKVLADYRKSTNQKSIEFYINLSQARVLRGQEKWGEAVDFLKKLEGVKRKKTIYDGILLIELGQNSEYVDAVSVYQSAIKVLQKNSLQNHYATALAYNNLAFCYGKVDMIKEALSINGKSLEIWSKYYRQDVNILSTSYNNAIYDYLDYGDRDKCQKYQKAFEAIMNEHFVRFSSGKFIPKGNYDDLHARMMFHLSSVRYYGEFFDPNKIGNHLQSLEEVFKKCPKTYYEKEFYVLPAAYDAASYAYRIKGDYTNALKYNAISEKIAQSDFEKMKAQAMYAMIHYEQKQYSKSLQFAEKSLKSMEYNGKGTSFMTLSVLKAELLANLNRSVEATKVLQEVFKLMLKKNKEFSRIQISDFGEISSTYYINIFIHSGLVYRRIYELNGRKKADLKTMKHFFKLAAAMFERYYQKGIFNPSLDQYLRNIKEGLLYADARDSSVKEELYASLNTLESIGSQHLWQRFILRNEENLNLSKELLTKKNELQLRINALENSGKNTTIELESTKRELVKIEEEIYKQNPDFKRFSDSNFDLKLIQQKLTNDRIFVKYTVTDSTVFAHVIAKNDLKVFKLGAKNKIESLSKSYYQKLSNIDFGFIKQSKELYQILIEPLKIDADKTDFITEDFLSYIPFETLTDKKGKLLLTQTDISYNYSLKLWSVSTLKLGNYSLNLTGFAPEYRADVVASRDANNRLLYTASELEKIAETFRNTQIFKSISATKQNFLSSIGQSKIHHLAMHSLLNQNDYEQSSLLFQNNEKLYFNELYSLNFPSELVVLSACNTGVGQLQNGEGLMSISRALNYAGVKSLVHSLWQVPDKETAELMAYFYQNLADGLSKDMALAQSKRHFIDKNPAKNHPYYWAGFVLNGDNQPIEDGLSMWIFALAGSIILVGGIWFLRQRK
ncbi:MAG: CHAT domain-containing protein [Spirosomataceae bacterium]